MVLTVGIVEKSLAVETHEDDLHIFMALFALIASLSTVSYCQRSILMCYIFVASYFIFRTTYVDILFEDYRDWLRLSFFFIVALACTYLFSRTFQQRERDQFKHKKTQREILNLFESFVRVFHDGIVLTQGEEIKYTNKRVNKIFDVAPRKEAENHEH